MSELPALKHYLASQSGIRLALVFGSLATGKATPTSDLDIAIQAGDSLTVKQREELIDQLAALTGRPIDLIDLASVGEPLLNEIVNGGIRILGSDEDYARLMMQNLIAQADFVPLQQRLLKERRDAWIKP